MSDPPATYDALSASTTVVYLDGKDWRYEYPPGDSAFVALHRSLERELALLMAEFEHTLRETRAALRFQRARGSEIELDALETAIRPMLARQVIQHNALVDFDRKLASLCGRLDSAERAARDDLGLDDYGPDPAA
jgi:hypothetical protein